MLSNFTCVNVELNENDLQDLLTLINYTTDEIRTYTTEKCIKKTFKIIGSNDKTY